MKNILRSALLACAALVAALSLSASPALAEEDAVRFSFRFAGAEEGRELLLGNGDYIRGLNQSDLDFRMQQKGATPEEWTAFAADQVMAYTDGEKAFVGGVLSDIEALCAENGLALPDPGELVFIKTTMAEECGAGGYTHGSQIYLGQPALNYAMSGNDGASDYGRMLVTHELFHCLTRSDPAFRAGMYALLGFTVLPGDLDFGPDVAARIISNPDVEHHNACAGFRIGGEDVDCVPVFTTTRPFEAPGDSFFDLMAVGLVPVDDPDRMYDSGEAENFWQVFGENTGYVIDPEETLADNFAYALLYGEGIDWESPEIIHGILEYLKG